MEEGAIRKNPFSYQDRLTLGASGLEVPGLVSVPNLEATLQMHREYQWRIDEDTDYDWDGNITYSNTSVLWANNHELLARDLLMATAICHEIGKGLQLLGIDWHSQDDGELDGTDSKQRWNPDSGVISCPPGSLELGTDIDQLIEQALRLARFFAELGREWVVDEHHIYGEQCVDEEEGIYITTMDEWDLSCPDLPVINGLRNWNETSQEMEDEGFYFDGPALVEDCTKVLEGIVNLILLTPNAP